jgi:Uncharacterized protein conserved in bacteria
MKKTFKTLLIAFFILLCIDKVHANDFENNKSYYFEKCKVNPLPRSDIDICRDFNDYLKNESDSLNQKITENENLIKDIENDIMEIQKVIEEIKLQIEEKETQIEYLNERITILEISIEEKDSFIRNRLYDTQGLTSGNIYINMIMGSSSIGEFFSKISTINELTTYDHEIMLSLALDRTDLQEITALVTSDKAELETLRSNQEAAEKELYVQRAYHNEELERQYEASDKFKADMDEIQKSIEAGDTILNTPPPSSGSWGTPAASGVVTATEWHYPSLGGGAIHLGLDIGAPVGTPLYAPVNAVVIYMYTGCPTYGSGYGDYCAGGMGNNIVMLASVDGTTYAIKYYHMQQTNALGWSVGNFINVNKGQIVGYIGNSGSSTGAHVHIEVINLGNISLSDAALRYAYQGGSFGLGFGSTALNNRCSVKAAPCRSATSEIFGYYLGQRIG